LGFPAILTNNAFAGLCKAALTKHTMNTRVFLLLTLSVLSAPFVIAQGDKAADTPTQKIYALIDNYSLARDRKDTVLLKRILTPDIDQLVSTGEWRTGIRDAVRGMQQSSTGNPGTRTLTVEKVRFLDAKNALADARYEITTQGTTRKMWSTFVVVQQQGQWKIAAIRNMLPSEQP
jgi:uncharacterized protein (TIGR02246 family)